MSYNIIRMTFSNDTIEDYQQGIDDLLAIYTTENEPFTLMLDYSAYKDNGVIPLWVRLQALFKTWYIGRNSQWNKICVVINPTPETNAFLAWCARSLSNQWTTHIANDIDHAYQIAEEIGANLNLHQ